MNKIPSVVGSILCFIIGLSMGTATVVFNLPVIVMFPAALIMGVMVAVYTK